MYSILYFVIVNGMGEVQDFEFCLVS